MGYKVSIMVQALVFPNVQTRIRHLRPEYMTMGFSSSSLGMSSQTSPSASTEVAVITPPRKFVPFPFEVSVNDSPWPLEPWGVLMANLFFSIVFHMFCVPSIIKN